MSSLHLAGAHILIILSFYSSLRAKHYEALQRALDLLPLLAPGTTEKAKWKGRSEAWQEPLFRVASARKRIGSYFICCESEMEFI
jgi:hypothetical protein